MSWSRGAAEEVRHPSVIWQCHLVEYVLFYMVIMEHVMKKQNGVEENFQVVYLQNRKVLEE